MNIYTKQSYRPAWLFLHVRSAWSSWFLLSGSCPIALTLTADSPILARSRCPSATKLDPRPIFMVLINPSTTISRNSKWYCLCDLFWMKWWKITLLINQLKDLTSNVILLDKVDRILLYKKKLILSLAIIHILFWSKLFIHVTCNIGVINPNFLGKEHPNSRKST